jgi:Zn ribbon nucleic-acid-binding protein
VGNGLVGVVCPNCNADDSSVVDSRNANGFIRRRRHCRDCGSRFSTHEKYVFESVKAGVGLKSNNLPRIMSDDDHIKEMMSLFDKVIENDGRTEQGICLSCKAPRGLVHREGCVVHNGLAVKAAFLRTEAGRKKSIIEFHPSAVEYFDEDGLDRFVDIYEA